MFRKNTTFVIGAGASAEFGLPVGWDLAKKIKARSRCNRRRSGALVPKDEFLTEFLASRFTAEELPAIYRALDTISEGIRTAVSIDAFIDRYRENKMITRLGKLLIALEIANAEYKSIMHPDLTEDFGANTETADDKWIGSFARILFDGVNDPDEVGANVTIICFNYDRCIEHYLTDAISAAYDIAIEDVGEIVSKMNIIHPYGTLGDLPTKGNMSGPGVLPFGTRLDTDIDWVDLAEKNIRTYTEQQHEPAMIKRIHDAVAHAGAMVFLGFGFNNQNLDLLRVANIPEYGEPEPRNLYSSGLGIAQQVDQTIKRRIMHLLWDNPHRHKLYRDRVHVEYGQSCSELFATHSMNFSSFTRSYFIDTAPTGGLQRVVTSSPRVDD